MLGIYVLCLGAALPAGPPTPAITGCWVWDKHTYAATSEDGKKIDSYTFDGTGLKPDGTGTLRLTGKATENGSPVDIRQTMTIAADHLDILRESRLKGEKFKFRHKFSFVWVSGS